MKKRSPIVRMLVLPVAAMAMAGIVSGCSSRAQSSAASDESNSGQATALAKASETPASNETTPEEGTPSDESYVIKRVLTIDGPFRHGDYIWDDEGVPDGPVVVTVDLKAQVLSVFKGGYEIGAAVILYGADEKPTPTGVYPVTEKDADHVSNLYGSPMPYMLRMTNDGISVHGSEIDWGYATHGCVGVPVDFAEKLFAVIKLGDKIIVTDGEMLEAGEPITAA